MDGTTNTTTGFEAEISNAEGFVRKEFIAVESWVTNAWHSAVTEAKKLIGEGETLIGIKQADPVPAAQPVPVAAPEPAAVVVDPPAPAATVAGDPPTV